MSFFMKTIDSIIEDITKKIEQLHAVAAVHAEVSRLNSEAIAKSTELRDFAESEYARAKAIAAKFEALVSQ